LVHLKWRHGEAARLSVCPDFSFDDWLLGHMARFGFRRGLGPFLVSGLFFASTCANDTLTISVWHVHLHYSHNAPESSRFEGSQEHFHATRPPVTSRAAVTSSAALFKDCFAFLEHAALRGVS
jgi:hypothetical protein